MAVKTRLIVADAMSHTIRAAAPADTVREVAEMMRQEDTGCIPIADDGRLVGIITDRDIVLRCLASGRMDPNEPVRMIMTSPVFTARPDDDLSAAARMMAAHAVRRLPVVDEGRLTGVLTLGNLIQATQMNGASGEAALGVTRGA